MAALLPPCPSLAALRALGVALPPLLLLHRLLLFLHRTELLLPRLDERELQRLPPQPEGRLARLPVVGLAAVVAQVGLKGGRGWGGGGGRFGGREARGMLRESWRRGVYGEATTARGAGARLHGPRRGLLGRVQRVRRRGSLGLPVGIVHAGRRPVGLGPLLSVIKVLCQLSVQARLVARPFQQTVCPDTNIRLAWEEGSG